MGLNDVVRQMENDPSLSANGATAAPADDSTALQPPEPANAPSLTFTMDGRQVTLNAHTLALYGIVLADLLLIYIATRV